MSKFQKIALATLISVIVLIFVGAVVRATGAGMGCPDWPKCWGKYIPPTDKSQIDVSTLPIEKYKAKRAAAGGNPDDITEETVLAEFNPVHTWIEFINRMCSMPVGIFSLLLMIYSFKFRSSRPALFWGAFTSLFLVGLSAWMGKRIVESGLKPGVITSHMAFAILLMCVLVYLVWAGGERKKLINFNKLGGYIKRVGLVLFVLILAEGVMGSQVREMTDTLKISHANEPRKLWVGELEQTWMYIVHRSFSWMILAYAVYLFFLCRKHRVGGVKWQENVILAMVVSQMVLGLILSQVGILPVVQVLHIGLSSILVSAMFAWILGAWGRNEVQD